MDKVAFLQNENNQLREQLQDLKELLKMNKVEIDILSKQLQTNPQTKKMMEVLLSYRQREEKKNKQVIAMKKEVSQLVTDNLILSQMNDQLSEENKNSERMQAEALTVFQNKVRQLQEKLLFFQKSHKQYDKIAGFVVKHREVFSPVQISLQLKDKEEEWNNQIAIMKAEVEQAKKNAENLMVVNTVLRNKIVTLQAKLAMPNKNMGEVLDKSLKKLMIYFIEVQKKIITGEEESDTDEENDLQLIAPQLPELFPEKKLRAQKDYGVPHLDLLKIRQQINHSTNKIKEALLARNHLSDKQKIQRLEIELEYTRRQLSRNIIDLRDQKQTRKRAEAFIREIQSRNQLLAYSNKQLEAKVRKYWQKLQKQKMKYYGPNKIQRQSEEMNEVSNPLQETLLLKQPSQKPLKQKQETVKKAQLGVQSHLDYKIHLQFLARELQNNPKMNKLQKLKVKQQQKEGDVENQPRRIKRSTSNPFLYFNQRREEIMHLKDDDEQEDDQRFRLEQTCYNGNPMGFEEVLDDLDV